MQIMGAAGVNAPARSLVDMAEGAPLQRDPRPVGQSTTDCELPKSLREYLARYAEEQGPDCPSCRASMLCLPQYAYCVECGVSVLKAEMSWS